MSLRDEFARTIQSRLADPIALEAEHTDGAHLDAPDFLGKNIRDITVIFDMLIRLAEEIDTLNARLSEHD